MASGRPVPRPDGGRPRGFQAAAPHSASRRTARARPAALEIDGADAVVLVTEWPEYRDLAWDQLAPTMQSPVMLDGRNHLDRCRLESAGFRVISLAG